MKIKKILGILLFCFIVGLANIYGVEYKVGIENFPESYRPYLYALQEKHPNWEFTAMYTGLDWNTVITKESHLSNRLSVSLAPSSWDDAWHYFLANGSTNRVEQGWVTASSNAVRYTMDPRNFLNEKTIFQFEEMTYNKDIHTLQGVEKILYGTEMSKTVTELIDGKNVTKYVIKDIEYYQIVNGEDKLKTVCAVNLRKSPSASGEFIKTVAKGNVVTTLELTATIDTTGTWAKVKLSDGTEGYICRIAADGEAYLVAAGNTTTEYVKYLYDIDGDGVKESPLTYAESYMLAAEASGVNPYVLALRTKNETGCKISSNGQISGKATAAPGYYNYYSIGAYGSNPMENGVLYAKSKGWTNPVIAMREGAKFLGNDYILAGQNTPYLEKYNVNSNAKNGLYSHQYMTDITCIYREAFGMYSTYSELGILDNEFEFIIPVYNNMPNEAMDIYQQYKGYFQPEQDEITTNKATEIYSLVPTTGAGVQRVEMVTVPTGTNLMKIASGLASSYDKVKYEVDGSIMYGYIFYTNYDLATAEDNTKMEVIASPWVRLRSAPNTSSSQVATLYTGDIVTRIEKNSATNSTGIWDKVVTSDGKVGYVCRIYKDGADIYLKELSYNKVTGVSFEKENHEITSGDKIKLNYTILPDNATYKNVTFSSSDENIIKVDNLGNVTAYNAGKVTITITTEDQDKTATCEITVVPKITLDKEKYTVNIYEEFIPEVKVYGVDIEELQLLIEDENIISITEGKVRGEKIGKTKLIASLKEYDMIKVEAEVEVIHEDQEGNENHELQIVFEEGLKFTDNILTGIGFETSKESFLTKITTNGQVKFLDINGNELTGELLGTGTKIIIEKEEQKQEYTLLIYGDVTGDGKISPSDYVKVKNKILDKETMDEIFILASDVTKDNNISPSDYVKIKNTILGKETIEQ